MPGETKRMASEWLALRQRVQHQMQRPDPLPLPPLEAEQPALFETATFGLGCFWAPDAEFGGLPGVIRTRVGYCGGSTPQPNYSDLGDHTEAIQIDFDPNQISYRELLVEAQRIGDFGGPQEPRQYRSVVFVHDEGQRQEALALGLLEVEPVGIFTRAEGYHQKYYLQQERVAREFLAMFPEDAQFTDSTAVMRANAVAGGFLGGELLAELLPRMGVSLQTAQELAQMKPLGGCSFG